MSPESPSWFPRPRRGAQHSMPAARPVTPNRALTPEEVRAAVVDCGLYQAGERHGGMIELETALSKADACEDGFVWIGLHDPSTAVIEAVAEHFKLHPLAVEDAVNAHQRAKLEVYGDSLFMVLKTARYVDHDELVEIGELMVFLGERFVVVVRHGEGTPLKGVRRELESRPELLAMGPSSVLYAIADRIVDDYEQVIDGFAVDVDEIEEQVFSGADHNPAERIYKLKREVLEFKRAVHPLLGPLQKLAHNQTGLPLDPRTMPYFRDVQDHLVRDAERISSFDDLLTSVLHANLTQLQMRDNQDMRKISAVVAILAVPTMVFGLYGMNFDHMPELHWRYGYPIILVVTALLCFLLYRRFKRTGWL